MTRTRKKAAAYLGNGASLAIDGELCLGCGDCLEVCPHEVIELEARPAGGRRTPVAVVARRGDCMECGACATNCPAGAIAVKPGVGCVAAVINGKLRGTEPNCDCGDATSCC